MKRFEEWTIAYRKRNGGALLLNDRQSEFKTIRNTWRYWCADPHLWEYGDRTYVFAELYDRVLRRGVIGYCELDDNGATGWKVALKMPWHLSYPHVFSHGDGIYMIPESYAGKEIAVYKATSFPDRWEQVCVLKSNCVAIDSTLFHDQGRDWLQTLQIDDSGLRLNLYALKDGKLSETPYVITEDETNSRPAGKLFRYDGKLVRPAQDCSESYGCALNFYEVTKVAEDDYAETLLIKIKSSSLRTDLGAVPQGVHTYNFTEKYEVIDLKEYKTDLLYYVMRPIWAVWRRLKKLFGR